MRPTGAVSELDFDWARGRLAMTPAGRSGWSDAHWRPRQQQAVCCRSIGAARGARGRRGWTRRAPSQRSTKRWRSRVEIGEHSFDAVLHRFAVKSLLKRDPSNPAPAEDAFLDRHRHRAAARRAQFRSARRAFARQALPTDRPLRRSPRRPRACARRFFADARNARDR